MKKIPTFEGTMKTIRINKGRALNLPIRFIGVVGVIVIMIKLMETLSEPWSLIIVIAIASFLPALWFSYQVIIIDMEKKELFDGIWTMGKRLGSSTSFNGIEKIFINRIKTKQTMYSLSNKQNVLASYEYRAYIKLDSGEKFFLISHPIKEEIEEKVSKIRKKIGIE